MNKELYSLTNPQKSILLTEEFYKGSNINNICGTAIIDDVLDFELLKKAMHIFINNHDSFHFKLVLDNNEVKQYLDTIDNVDIEIVNIDSKDDIKKIEDDMLNHVFDIHNSDLFLMKIFRLKNNTGGFIVNVHHLFGDSWSLGIVANDIVRIYSCLLNDEHVIKNDNFSYLNYISSEKEYLDSDKFKKDKEYWENVFDTIPEQATIPSSKEIDKNDFSPKANRKSFNIDTDMMGKINAFCKSCNVSVFNFFMGVYATYIGRVSGVDDFVLGTPILNRTNFNEKNTTGMFINTAPLRFLIDDNLSFKSFVSNIAKDSLGMLRHQKYYYQNILEDLRKKDSSLPNLYNILLSYQVTKANTTEGINYNTRWNFNGNTADDMDIHLYDLNDTGSINIAYDYKIAKYDDSDIEAMHNRILHIIWQILEKNDMLLKDIEIVTPKEKHDILYKFNDTKVEYPLKNNLIELIEETASMYPNRIAIENEIESISYEDLIKKVYMLSNYLLHTINLKSNMNIGIFTDRNIETIIGILAIMKINCTYVPIDPNYPQDRIRYMIEQSGINVILYTDEKCKTLLDNKFNMISINTLNYNTFPYTIDISFNYCLNNNLYIIFTSGSTGKPKGVTLSHKNMMNLIFFEKTSTELFDSQTIHRVLQFATMSFDVSYQEIFSTFVTGSTLVLIEDETRKNITKLSNYILSKSIDTLFIPPAYLRLLTEDNSSIDKFSACLKNIITAGEPLLITSGINKLLSNGIKIHNHYGPAETHVVTTYTLLSSTDAINVPIGYPVSNTHIYIVSSNLHLLPINAIGQIAISGDCVGNGYLNRTDLNAEKFVNNPFNSNEKLYLTGDLGYCDKNGCIYYVGRADFQVKINGFRIELDEITQVLLKHPTIEFATSIIQNDNTKKHIICYYTSQNDIAENDLLKFLSLSLPNYMMPTKLVKLESFPLNHNGKIDKKMLPKVNLLEVSNEFLEASSKTELVLQKIWMELFKTNKIGANYNFFNIGGDSLLAIKLCSLLLNNLQVDLTVNDIFNHPILKDLAYFIDTKNTLNTIEIIQKCDKKDYYPLSSAQKRIYYASSLDANSTLYNIAGGIIVNDLLDTKKLENCFNVLINRHDALRTHFDIKDNDIVQIVDDKIDFSLELDTATSDNLNDIYSNFVKPFDLSKAPLFRTKLVKLSDNKMLFLLDMHHIISDGTSLSILLQELCDLYNGSTLSEKQIDYTDFTLWEKEQFNTDEFNSEKAYWVNQFNDEIPLLNMPTSYPRPSTQSFDGSNYHTVLSKDVFDKVNRVSKELNITPYMLMLSCYYILLSKYSSNDDIVVGTPIVGRNLQELNNVLGMFVNTLALRNKIDSSLNFNKFTENIKENCINSFKNQDYPFDMLVKDLNIQRDSSRNPLFDVMFVYQNNGYPKINFKGTEIQYFIPDNNISKFDLTLEIIPVDNEYSLRFEYCTKLFDEDFIKRLSSHYINILNAILENNNIKIADIDMLSNEERNQILYDFNDTKMDYPSDKTIVDLFEEQVEKIPDNIAVVFEDKKLTYRELNEKANQLARFLLDNNAISNDIICLLLDKSLESIIAIIAILKIGATYLPIDVNYPNDRIDYIINDSKAKILLTTKDNIHKSNHSIQALCIDFDSALYSQYDSNNINCENLSFDSIAYIMYTSGSTGKPKGVMVKHRNIVRLVKNNSFIEFSQNERILQTGSIVFDACTFEIFGALLNGFELYIIKKEELLDSSLLQDYLIKNKITVLWLTAPLFNQLCEDNPHMFRSVKTLLTGGDVLSPKHINMAMTANPNLTIINGYGPTENTTFSCCFTVDKKYTNSIPIGKPISNSTAYVVSPSGNLCPIGVPGELWVGGDGVSKGYLNNSVLTNEKFTKNPFADGLIYKTGDLVKWLPNGCIDFIGRIDNQVKIRGFRVELGEINAKLSTFPSMKECVTVVNDIKGEKCICSYIVSNRTVDVQELKQYLKKFLPVYMIPTYFMQLEKLPINTNGKVDRKLLPINFKTKHLKHIIKQPTNENEVILLDIYKKLLSFDDIGTDDDFFELGGDSLLAIKLQVEAISNNLQITYADIFEHPTIEDLAKCINHKEDTFAENDYDYEKYNVLLEKNVITEDMKIENTPIGNMLLTGFTGFLGAHVLDSFIKKETGTIYCLIRGKNGMSPEDRLKNVLNFYFDTKYDKYIGTRIKLVDGDITLPDLGLNNIDYNVLGTNVNTVVHCAALVKHYGNYKDFESINILGTKRIIDFSKTFDLKLLHVSTISVSGNNLAEGANIDNHFEHDMIFNETNFYIGQNLNNFYVRSKFEAEKLVLDAILDGLQGCILRMGNLTSRFSEGKFQQNHFENAFVNRLKSFLQIGVFPKSLLNLYCEFTPIDYCGDAIISIASHMSKDYTIFHLLNEKQVYLNRLFDMLNEIGINIRLISDEEFSSTINTLLQDSSKKQKLEGIINDLNSDKLLVYKSQVNIKSDFTKEFLSKADFEWPYIDINYIRNYFKYLSNIGYFNLNINKEED